MPDTAAVDLVAEQSRLGGLERWLADPTVDELLVNGGGEIWVDRAGRLGPVGRMRATTLMAAIEQLLAPTGRRVDRAQPMVEARLDDGSRVCAAIPPVSVDGPCLSIRRFSPRSLPLASFAPEAVASLLRALVDTRANIVVSGATSSGKTTLLTALAAHVAPHERIVTLEDTAEVRLQHPHVVRLEARDATPDGVGAITLTELLRTALRLRPDRLVVGEIRGSEAIDLLQALNTGHDGSMATLHANGPVDALARLSSLVLRGAANWPLASVRDHVTRAVDAVVHVERCADGTRRVVAVAEVEPDCEVPTTRPLADHETVLASPTRTRR